MKRNPCQTLLLRFYVDDDREFQSLIWKFRRQFAVDKPLFHLSTDVARRRFSPCLPPGFALSHVSFFFPYTFESITEDRARLLLGNSSTYENSSPSRGHSRGLALISRISRASCAKNVRTNEDSGEEEGGGWVDCTVDDIGWWWEYYRTRARVRYEENSRTALI